MNGYIPEALRSFRREHLHYIGAAKNEEGHFIARYGDEVLFFQQDKNNNVVSEIRISKQDAINLAIWILRHNNS